MVIEYFDLNFLFFCTIEDFVVAEIHIILLSLRKFTFWLLLYNIYDFIRFPSEA